MKNTVQKLLRVALVAVLFALLPLAARADYTTVSVTVTNILPADGQTIIINGSTRTWKTTVSDATIQIQVTNTFGAATSNLFAHLVSFRVPNVNVVTNGTNGVNLSSLQALTVTALTNWAQLSTNILISTNGAPVQVPASVYTVPRATNVFTLVVDAINSFAIDALDQTKAVAAQLLGTTNTQSASNKTFYLTVIVGGTNVGTVILNSTAISGTVVALTNGYWLNPTLTNGSNFGLPFRSPGGGNGSEQFGLNASASTNFGAAFGSSAQATGISSSAFGNTAHAISNSSSAFGTFATATGTESTALGNAASTYGADSVSIGEGAITGAGHDFSVALGSLSQTTVAHQLMMGTSSEFVQFPGGALHQGTDTNIIAGGTNTINAALVWTAFGNSSLANSNNADVAIGTNVYIQVSGPSGPFFIAGFSGGIDGRVIYIENSTGQDMWIGNQSGVESTAANRILSGYSADRKFTNNPFVGGFRYDGAANRWKLFSVN